MTSIIAVRVNPDLRKVECRIASIYHQSGIFIIRRAPLSASKCPITGRVYQDHRTPTPATGWPAADWWPVFGGLTVWGTGRSENPVKSGIHAGAAARSGTPADPPTFLTASGKGRLWVRGTGRMGSSKAKPLKQRIFSVTRASNKEQNWLFTFRQQLAIYQSHPHKRMYLLKQHQLFINIV